MIQELREIHHNKYYETQKERTDLLESASFSSQINIDTIKSNAQPELEVIEYKEYKPSDITHDELNQTSKSNKTGISKFSEVSKEERILHNTVKILERSDSNSSIIMNIESMMKLLLQSRPQISEKSQTLELQTRLDSQTLLNKKLENRIEALETKLHWAETETHRQKEANYELSKELKEVRAEAKEKVARLTEAIENERSLAASLMEKLNSQKEAPEPKKSFLIQHEETPSAKADPLSFRNQNESPSFAAPPVKKIPTKLAPKKPEKENLTRDWQRSNSVTLSKPNHLQREDDKALQELRELHAKLSSLKSRRQEFESQKSAMIKGMGDEIKKSPHTSGVKRSISRNLFQR